jgi:hypothetical protein
LRSQRHNTDPHHAYFLSDHLLMGIASLLEHLCAAPVNVPAMIDADTGCMLSLIQARSRCMT